MWPISHHGNIEAKVRSHKTSFAETEGHRVGLFLESFLESQTSQSRKYIRLGRANTRGSYQYYRYRAEIISNALRINYLSHRRPPQEISALGTARQARADLAVTSSGPRLHLDSKSALDLAILTSCPTERIGTNLLEAGQQTSTMLHTLPGSPASSLPSTS